MQCTHFTLANDTPDCRVSLDMRVVPGEAFDPDPPDSRGADGKPLFFVGGYYAVAACREGAWLVERDTLVPGAFDCM